MNVNFIPCLTWVPRGKAKAVPDKIQLTEDDLKRVIDETKNKMGNSAEGHPEGMETNDEDDIVQRYNLDDYDDDDEEEEEMEGGDDNNVNIAMNDMRSLANLTVFASNSNDPYLSRETGDSDSEEEKDNFEIKESDNLLVIGHVEGNSSVLEVHVYNSEQEDFYPHHDIVLGSYPLCFQSLSLPDKTNCVACGDMSPDISIWDLDVVNLLEPVVKLSGHKESVLSLAWDELNHLVSGSADKNVFLWDLNEGKKMSKVKKCKGNIQGVSFQPESKDIILMGDDKGNAFVSDIRSPGSSKSWIFPDCEIEGLLFDQLRGNNFFIATDQGTVFYCDSRVESKPIYSLDAHSEAVTGICQSSIRKDCLVTASADKTLKVWNISSGEKASFVTEHSRVKVGRIMTVNFSPDDPFIVAVGGDTASNNYKILDLSTLKAVKEAFGLKK